MGYGCLKVTTTIILNMLAFYFLITGMIEASGQKEVFRKESKLEICANMTYEVCDRYLAKECVYHTVCDKRRCSGRKNRNCHCVHYRKYYICEDIKGFNVSQANEYGFSTVCESCAPHPRSYEFDLQFECNKLCLNYSNEFMGQNPTANCTQKVLNQCMRGGENYPYIPTPEDYLCKPNGTSHEFEEPQFGATQFLEPNDVRNIFYYWGDLLWDAFDILDIVSILVFIFFAFPCDLIWPCSVRAKPTRHAKGGTLALYGPLHSLFYCLSGVVAPLLIVFVDLSLHFEECIELQINETLFTYIMSIVITLYITAALATIFSVCSCKLCRERCLCGIPSQACHIIVMIGLLFQLLGLLALVHIYHYSHHLDAIGKYYAIYLLICLLKCGLAMFMWWPNAAEYDLLKKQISLNKKAEDAAQGQPIQYVPQPVPQPMYQVPEHEKIY